MVTTNPENLFHKLAQRDRWNLKDMAKKDEWLLRTSTLLHKAGVAVALKHGRPTVASIKAIQPKLGLRTVQAMLENLVPAYELHYPLLRRADQHRLRRASQPARPL